MRLSDLVGDSFRAPPAQCLGRDRSAARGVHLFVAGVRDQSLGAREFQLEGIAQENAEAWLDIVGFVLRTGVSVQPMIRVTDIVQPAIVGVIGVLGGKLPRDFGGRAGFHDTMSTTQPLR
jgi:hypothetical protein